MLDVTGLGKTYQGRKGSVVALADVSCQAKPGEFLAVEGPSGCGKTTLLLAAGGLLMPTTGQVRINGQDPYALRAEARARFRAETIGFVFQRFHLVPFLDVRDNILAPALAVRQDGVEARAAELMERFGLTDRAHHVPAELSVGERQRVALARALLNRPKILMADEPTGNLDEANGKAVLEYLADFAKNGGTVLLVTHDSRATGYAQRTVRMEAGRVAADA